MPITFVKYVHARLKRCDDQFTLNSQYIFHMLDWIDCKKAWNSVTFGERKQFRSEVTAGQLLNQG